MFRYKAATADGSVVRGYHPGDSRAEVVAALQALGQIPIRVDLSEGPKRVKSKFRIRRQRVTDEQIADLTRQLSTLLKAGFPLERALSVLLALQDGTPLGAHLADIRERVKSGWTLADAVAEQGTVFGRFYVNLLRAGETGGALELVLERLADYLENSREVREALVSALIYPAVLVVVAFASIFILLAYVVPQFSQMFEGAEQALPLSTQITIAVGAGLQRYGWLALLLGGVIALFMRKHLESPVNRVRWHARLLAVPIAGDLILKAEVARFSRTLATLLQNGMALLKALEIAKDTLSNGALAESLGRVSDAVKQGRSLADPLEELTLFPVFAVHMIRVGEESGNLQQILIQVADAYDRDTRTTIKRALAVLEPALILVLGVIIAAVIISILVAILSVNELVI